MAGLLKKNRPMNFQSTSLAKSTCLIHPERPATARCPGCGTFYCGECITEHDGKLTCARCLAGEQNGSANTDKKRGLPIMPFAHLAIGLTVCWMIYYFVAQVLLSIPADFHDGAIWE